MRDIHSMCRYQLCSNVLPFPITNYSSFEIFSRASPGSFTICFPYRFAIYDTSKAWITERKGGQSVGYLTRFLLAGFSGAVGAVVGGPPDLVLVRMQADVRLPKEHRRPYRNGLHGMWCIYRLEGVAKMFHGLEWNAARAASVTIGQVWELTANISSLFLSIVKKIIDLPLKTVTYVRVISAVPCWLFPT